MPLHTRCCVSPRRALLFTAACIWLSVGSSLAQCTAPIIQSIVIESTFRVTVTLVNASAPALDLAFYYFNDTGSFSTIYSPNVSGGFQLTITGTSLPVLAVAVLDRGKPATQSWKPNGTIESQQAVIIVRPSASLVALPQDTLTKFVEALESTSCTGRQPLTLPANSTTVKLCQLGAGRSQYVVVSSSQSPCPNVVISELSMGPAGQYVELYIEGSSDIDLSGFSLALFNAATNGSVFVTPLSTRTNLLGFATINVTALLPAATVVPEHAVVAVYARVLNSSVPLNLAESSNRIGIKAALAFAKGSPADGVKDKQMQAIVTLFGGGIARAVWLGRSQSEPLSLSYCLGVTSQALASQALGRFILSPPTLAAPNNCTGVPASAPRASVLRINEFNADIPGPDTLGNLTEYVELRINGAANSSLGNYYIVLYRGTSALAYRVFSLDSVVVSAGKKFVVLGTKDVCGMDCDATMPGNTIINGVGAIAVHYREEGPIIPGWSASLDGLVDAYVYTADNVRTLSSDGALLARLLGFSENSSHFVHEDDNAFVLDESIGLCEADEMRLMPLTPGKDNDCSLTPSAGRSTRTAADAGLTSLVYINEWQPTADGRSEYVELVGTPGTAISRLRLVASAWNVSTGAVSRTSYIVRLSDDARLSPTGLYSLTNIELSRLKIAAAPSDAEALAAYGNGSRLAYRLTLAAASSAPGAAYWHDKEKLIPLDAVSVAAPVDALLRRGGELVPLDLGSTASNSLSSQSASRCRLNASAPASSAANSPDFDVSPVTRNATNWCPPPFQVLINEVTFTGNAATDYVELLIQGTNTSVAAASLSGFVLVYWNGSDGKVAASIGLSQSLPPRVATDLIVVVEGFARPTTVWRYVLALYYDYDFLYPLGAAATTSTRLLDNIGFSTDSNRSALSDSLVDIFHLLHPTNTSVFYAQGVVTMVGGEQSLSRCPDRRDRSVDAFEPSTLATRSQPNTPCNVSSSRGRESITVQHCLQRKFLRINELAIGSDGNGFVELITTDPSATPDLPLADLQLVFYWASGNGNASESWSILNSSIAQPLSAYSMSKNGSGHCAVSLTAFQPSNPVSTPQPPAFRDAVVLCAALLFDDKRYYDGQLPPPSAQLSVAAYRAAIEERFVDAIAVFVGKEPAAQVSVAGAAWPLTPGYAPLASDGGLLGTTSFSRCYSTALSRANAAFAASAVSTRGAANSCPPPPVRLRRLCVTGGLTVTVRLESAVVKLPLERLRAVAYLDPLQPKTVASPDTARAAGLTFAADAISSVDSAVNATATVVQQASDSFLAAAVFFYPPNVAMSPDTPSLLLTGNATPLPQTVHAIMLHNRSGEGVWERAAVLLNISKLDVPLVPLPQGATTVCVTGCRDADDKWTVRDIGVDILNASTCPARPWELVLINEIDVDQPGKDQHEFIELLGPPGLDASDYAIEIVYKDHIFDLPLQGKFNSAGFFVIGTSTVFNQSMLLPADGILPNDGGAIALYKRKGSVQGTGLQDIVAFATSSDDAQAAMAKSKIAEKYPLSARSFLIEDATAYSGIASLSRCFCNTTAEHSCFALSLHPTPGTENFCIRRDQPLQLKFCLDVPVAQVNQAAVKAALASAIGSNCSCAFSEYQLSDMKPCDAGVQFDAFGTTSNHLEAIRRGFAAAVDRDLLTPDSGNRVARINRNCSLSCPAASLAAPGGSNGGVVAGVVVSVLLLIVAGGVAVYWIRKKRADRGFQMARFDGAFDDDDAFAGDNASGRVTFSNPFRPSSTERRQYMKL